jgi:hypothetical protein
MRIFRAMSSCAWKAEGSEIDLRALRRLFYPLTPNRRPCRSVFEGAPKPGTLTNERSEWRKNPP